MRSLIALTIACSIISLARPGPAIAQQIVGRNPGHIRVVFEDDPARAATVGWSTSRGAGDHVVYYDTQPRFGQRAAYRHRIDAQHNGAYSDGPDHFHHARLYTLQPDTVYHFVVESDGALSTERSFRTAPLDPGQPFRLLVGGDSRTSGDLDGPERRARQTMNGVMRQLFEEDDTIIALSHGGDYVNDGDDWDQWSAWLDDHTLMTTRADGRVLPIIPTRGNHEDDEALYNEIFGYPGNGMGYFVTRIGDFALVTLNTERDIDPDDSDEPTPQSLWLRYRLAALNRVDSASRARWITASYHRPAYPAHKGYSSGNAGDIRRHWVPLFGQFGVNLVFESDGHTYKRTLPLLNRGRVDRAPDCDPGDDSEDPVVCGDAVTTVERGGVYYVGEGGLGAPLREVRQNRAYLEPGRSRTMAHVMLLDVEPEALTLHVVDDAGCFVDEPGGDACALDRFEDEPLTLTPRTVLPFGSAWRFLDDAVRFPTGFELPGFDEAGWGAGTAQLGYGDGDEVSELQPGRPSVYFRRSLWVDHPVDAAEITALHDDGVAIYVNGQLVASRYVSSPEAHAAFADRQSDDDEITHFGGQAITDAFVQGHNVIAVVVKQHAATSSDVSFDLRITLTGPRGGGGSEPPAEVPLACVDACRSRAAVGCEGFDIETCWAECTAEAALGCADYEGLLQCVIAADGQGACGQGVGFGIEDGIAFGACFFDQLRVHYGCGIDPF